MSMAAAMAEIERLNERVDALTAMLTKKMELIRCGISANYSGNPKENDKYMEAHNLLHNSKIEGGK